jgi:hypothetical protein
VECSVQHEIYVLLYKDTYSFLHHVFYVCSPIIWYFLLFEILLRRGQNAKQRNSGNSISVVRWRWSTIFTSLLVRYHFSSLLGSGPAEWSAHLCPFSFPQFLFQFLFSEELTLKIIFFSRWKKKSWEKHENNQPCLAILASSDKSWRCRNYSRNHAVALYRTSVWLCGRFHRQSSSVIHIRPTDSIVV